MTIIAVSLALLLQATPPAGGDAIATAATAGEAAAEQTDYNLVEGVRWLIQADDMMKLPDRQQSRAAEALFLDREMTCERALRIQAMVGAAKERLTVSDQTDITFEVDAIIRHNCSPVPH